MPPFQRLPSSTCLQDFNMIHARYTGCQPLSTHFISPFSKPLLFTLPLPFQSRRPVFCSQYWTFVLLQQCWMLFKEKISICGSILVVEGILGKAWLEGKEGRCGGVWCQRALLLGCMRGGMTAVRSIVCMPSLFPEWLGGLGISCWSITCDMCITDNGVYAFVKACGWIYAQYVHCVKSDERNMTSLSEGNLWMTHEKKNNELWFPWAIRLASGSGGAHNLSDLDMERAQCQGRKWQLSSIT